jgi:hypothetical protein
MYILRPAPPRAGAFFCQVLEGMRGNRASDGCEVELEVWPRMPHAWHVGARLMPEAGAVIALHRRVRAGEVATGRRRVKLELQLPNLRWCRSSTASRNRLELHANRSLLVRTALTPPPALE